MEYFDTTEQQRAAEQGGGVTVCPACGGGRTAELSCNVYNNDGRWWWKCHRASCNTARPLEGSHLLEVQPRVTLKDYTGRVESVPHPVENWLVHRYPLLKPHSIDSHVRWNPDRETLLFPFRSHASNVVVGFVERAAKPGEDSPLQSYRRLGPSWKDKAKTWYQEIEHKGKMGWYGSRIRGRAVLVEDPLSAIILANYARDFCVIGLMGTGLNDDKIAELHAGGIDHVRLALDKDATSLAFKHAAKFGLAFDSCKVTPLSKDIKDLESERELHDLRFFQ